MSFSPLVKAFQGSLALRGDIADVFPLFSPLGEVKWVPGWQPELLHPTGVPWTRGQVFRTAEESGPAVWVVTRLDPSRHEVEYHRVESGHYVARIEVSCRDSGEGLTEVSTTYAFIGLSEAGNREIGAMTQAAYDAKMVRWATWIADHLGTRR